VLADSGVLPAVAEHPHKKVLELLVADKHIVDEEQVQMEGSEEVLVEQGVASEVDGEEVESLETVDELHLVLICQSLCRLQAQDLPNYL